MVTTPSSSGWRRLLEDGEPELGEPVKEQHAVVGERHLALAWGMPPPPTRAGEEMLWCGARNGRAVTSGAPAGSIPATL